jgi:hypothetical protein
MSLRRGRMFERVEGDATEWLTTSVTRLDLQTASLCKNNKSPEYGLKSATKHNAYNNNSIFKFINLWSIIGFWL